MMDVRLVRDAVVPDAPEDFEQSVAQAAQGIGMGTSLVPVVLIVDPAPVRSRKPLRGPQVDGVAKVFIAAASKMDPRALA